MRAEPTAERTEVQGPGPVLDIRIRWRAGRVALAAAGLVVLVSLARPLAPGGSPRIRLAVILALGLGTAGTALLTSLRGRSHAELLAFYAFLTLSLDGLGQILGPVGWPGWPLMVLLVGSLAVAETLPIALSVAALAALLAAADAAASSFREWKPALTAALGYSALALAVNRALLGEKNRLSLALAELARLKHGIDQLDEAPGSTPVRLNTASLTLHQVSEEGRRARQLDRAVELDATLSRLVSLARQALGAHAVVYFDVDRQQERAYLRASDGPPTVIPGSVVPVSLDPFAFVLDRKTAFYATDFKRLLWSLPYYRGEVKIGSLLAVPVRTSDDVVAGVLLADRVEIQSFTEAEPRILESFAEMAGEEILRARAALGREELGAEFKAVYEVSRRLAALVEEGAVQRLLLQSSRELVPLEGGAVVRSDESQTRYIVAAAHGWAKEYEGREVGLSERTWAAWVLRSAEEAYLLDDVAGHEDRMPVLVLDEASWRADSLLAVPLKARNRTLGALILTGRRGAFDATAHRVLGILANQAAATLSVIQEKERAKEAAVRDGLTGLYNRRAFSELLSQALAREERHGGRFGLLLLDIDHFKKLNDTFGHPAGDLALRHVAQVLSRHLRKGDQAARFGGEEFAMILPSTDEAGAVRLAERVREALASAPLTFEGARLSLSASLGAAVWPADGRDADALVAGADRALYAAKEAGRNRVATASSVAARPSAPGP